MTRTERSEMWRERVAAFQASGQSVAAWCREQEIKEHQLRYWLRQSAPAEASTTQEPPATRWLPITVLQGEQGDSENSLLVRAGDAVIEVRPGFDRTLLAEVVQVLAVRC